jgi:hypothetical protein
MSASRPRKPSRTIPNDSLQHLLLAKALSSGLSKEHAETLRLEALSASQVASLGRPFVKAGAMRIPYFDPVGKPTSFYRLRYLEPMPGFDGLLAKPQRYVQPADTLNEVYLPPLLAGPWETLVADPDSPVSITEGELKAACACSRGLPTIGLGGVDVWCSAKRGLDLLPGLAEFAWLGRQVNIIFDSDAAHNPNVVRAQSRLAKELSNRGARPRIVKLPAGEDGSKVGLDDYLVSHEPADLVELIDSAEPWAEGVALWTMNEEIAYIKNPGIIVVRKTGQRMKPADFRNHAYVNRSHKVTDAKGATKRSSTAKAWLEWPNRYELSGITYKPGSPRVVDGMYNTWSGWGVEPVEGSIEPWTELLDYIFRGAADGVRRYFEQWCAYPLQHPGTKLFASALIWGIAQGTGKSLVGYTLGSIYGSNAAEISDDQLHSDFTDWAENKQFIMADEITGSDKRAEANRMKRLITQEVLRINAKYLPVYSVPDCVNYYFTSNQPDAFFLDNSDRRYFIHEVRDAPMPTSFYQEYDAWRRSSGPSHLFWHLLHLDTEGFDPRAHALPTASKLEMIQDAKSDLAAWCSALKDDPTTLLKVAIPHAAQCDLYTPSQLLTAYQASASSNFNRTTANGLGREMKRAGFRQVNAGGTISSNIGCVRLYAVRDSAAWSKASPRACSEHFNKYLKGSRPDKF